MRQPEFVLVTLFDVGSAVEAVDFFNDVKRPIGSEEVTRDVIEGGQKMELLSDERNAGS
jgi:hypothetical protein